MNHNHFTSESQVRRANQLNQNRFHGKTDFLSHTSLQYADLGRVLLNQSSLTHKPKRQLSKPIVVAPSLLDRANNRLILLRNKDNDAKTQPKTLNIHTDKSVNDTHSFDKTKEPWQHHRHWLSMIFALWFILAIGLLISTMYTA